MGLVRLDPLTVLDDETGQQFYFPEIGQDDPGVPSVTRAAPGGLERYVPPAPAPTVEIGEAQIERPVEIGDAQIEEVGSGAESANQRGVPVLSGLYDTIPQGLPRDPRLSTPSRQPDLGPLGGAPPASLPSQRGARPAASPSGYEADIAAAPNALPPEEAAPAGPRQGWYPKTREELAGMYANVGDQKRAAAASERDVLSAKGDIEAKGLGDEAALEADYARNYEEETRKAQAAAEGRWNDWKKRYDEAAASEVNPERFWSNRSSFQKGVWLLSLAAHAWTQDKYGGKNMALQMLQSEIDKDINAQESNRTHKLGALKGETAYLQQRDKMGQDALAERATLHGLKLTALKRGVEARVAALGPAAADAGYDKALAQIAEDEVKVGAGLFENLQKEEMAKAEIRAANYRARLAAQPKPKKEEPPAGPDIHPRLGVTGLGYDGRPTGIKIRGRTDAEYKANADAANQLITNANQRHSALEKFYIAAQDQGFLDTLRGGSRDVRALARKLSYQTAKQADPGGRLSDQDALAAMEMITGQKGTGWWETVRSPGEMTQVIGDAIQNHRSEVQNQLLGYVEPGVIDQVVWEPRSTTAQKGAGPRTPDDTRAELAGRYGGDPGIAPRRTEPLSQDRPETGLIYQAEKSAGKLPELAGPESRGVREFTLAGQEAAQKGDLAEMDRVIAQAKGSGLSEEAKARIVQELAVLRVETARNLHKRRALKGTADSTLHDPRFDDR